MTASSNFFSSTVMMARVQIGAPRHLDESQNLQVLRKVVMKAVPIMVARKRKKKA